MKSTDRFEEQAAPCEDHFPVAATLEEKGNAVCLQEHRSPAIMLSPASNESIFIDLPMHEAAEVTD